MIELNGQHIFIAGGSRGIGRATALMAAKAGARVTVNYATNQQAADEVVNKIRLDGGAAVAVRADLTIDGNATNAIAQGVQQLGPLTGLVISSGIFEGKLLEDMTLDFWNRTMSINLNATFLTTKAAATHLKATGGSIVIYTSTAGQRGSDVFSAYATSKGGQLLFMRSMAKELAPYNVRVNSVAPGWTETDMSRNAIDASGRKAIVRSIPLSRIGRPEDPAGAACFLLSDLGQFITGSTITVDGGFDMRG